MCACFAFSAVSSFSSWFCSAHDSDGSSMYMIRDPEPSVEPMVSDMRCIANHRQDSNDNNQRIEHTGHTQRYFLWISEGTMLDVAATLEKTA